MLKKKSIVLSDVESGSNQKAVLSLEEKDSGVYGTLRLYNFKNDLSGISSLGFYIDKKVFKAGLTYKSRMFYEFFVDLEKIPNKFSCAVVNFQNAIAKPILYGSSDGNKEDVYGCIINEISGENTYSGVKNVLDKYDVDFEEQEKEEIEKEIDKVLCQNDCVNCVYKKYFYEQQSIEKMAQTQEEKNEIEEDFKQEKQEQTSPMFIDKLRNQIDKLFEKNPIEDNLQRLIPDSKWVRVEYEDDGDFFVFGLMYDELSNVKYVCYGVPSVFEEEPPKELAGYPIWLPLDKTNRHGFGYWLTYQDASTGEPIKAIMD